MTAEEIEALKKEESAKAASGETSPSGESGQVERAAST